jgi:two-component system, NtrC family, nitrogen regulation sensor histidine kinase NtrY
VNASPDWWSLQPPSAAPSRLRRSADILLGKVVTLVLAAVALLLGIATFVLLSGGAPITLRPNVVFGTVLANVSVLLLLGAALAGRLTRVWVERRRGSAGSRLHVRLVLLFSVVAVTPSIVVAVFASAFFNLGIQSWFDDRIRSALDGSLSVARSSLEEHRNNIRSDALGVAISLQRASTFGNTQLLQQVLDQETTFHGLIQAVIYDPLTHQVMLSAGVLSANFVELPTDQEIEPARNNEVAVIGGGTENHVRAVVKLGEAPELMLMVDRPVDTQIIADVERTERLVAEYKRLDANRNKLQVTFALIFALVALLVLSAAVLTGLVLANQIARPVGWLIQAAERVRAGDLAVRVPEVRSEDEMAGLSRAFNRMTGQLAAQRTELMDAYAQIDERRRFTETVLAGVSAGVIGLDRQGRVDLPNRAASELMGTDLMAAVGLPLGHVVPEFAPLLQEAQANPERPGTAEVQVGPPSNRRTLLVRIGAELVSSEIGGFVVTFDDITELQRAQRKAAWSDVARRIAHEIKNPLTPIQLAAERLKRRFTKEITSDPETFVQCADTIVRHVGDIGRMVDEFSAFARMPLPVIKPEDISRVAREAMVLQRNAHPEIVWTTDLPERGPVVPCDRRQLVQALANLLMNAADAVAMRPRAPGEPAGAITVALSQQPGEVHLSVSDDGIGLPQADRGRLTEPYVTHKPKGTGLGLAIVKKIMEDHGGRLVLEDRAEGPGAVVTLILPTAEADIMAKTTHGA